MEIIVNPVEVELAAMSTWANKLAVKMDSFRKEQDRNTKDKKADELINMIEAQVKSIRDSELMRSFGPEEREIVEEGLMQLDDMLVVLRTQQKILKILRGMDV